MLTDVDEIAASSIAEVEYVDSMSLDWSGSAVTVDATTFRTSVRRRLAGGGQSNGGYEGKLVGIASGFSSGLCFPPGLRL